MTSEGQPSEPAPIPGEANPFIATRREADRNALSDQDRNRIWWEIKPMTYAPWEAGERLPANAAQFAEMERYLLAKSPFLREQFDWTELAGHDVLDIGCGAGVLSCRLARHGARVIAADITEQATQLAARNAALQELSVPIIRTDAESLVFADASFDYVLAWGVLHHSRSTETALSEVQRVLRPGGRGLIMVYHRTSLVYYFKGLYWLVLRGRILKGDTLDSVTNQYVDGYYHRHFRRAELAACLKTVGLQPTRVKATQQQESILPGLRGRLDEVLKARLGWYLVAEFLKPTAA